MKIGCAKKCSLSIVFFRQRTTQPSLFSKWKAHAAEEQANFLSELQRISFFGSCSANFEPVFHYGYFDSVLPEQITFQKGQEVILSVHEHRRVLNSRLHSAGHILDICMRNIGLASLEAGKGHHFPDGAFVEYKGKIPANDLENKREALEKEAKRLVATGGKVAAAIVPYESAAALCGGELPEYIPKDTTPRIVTLGDNLGGPCGGTHVADISDIGNIKVSQIRVRKGLTKVSYTIEP